MTKQMPEDIDPLWASWLAGLVDGEGCFQFRLDTNRRDRRVLPHASLTIGLRSDDRAILVEIRHTLNLGAIYDAKAYGSTQPTSRWTVSACRDCLWLARFFEVYPLRSKKRRDFEVWAAAIRAWANGAAKNDLRQYVTRIQEVRRFRTAPTGRPMALPSMQQRLPE